MQTLIKHKTTIRSLFIILVPAFFGLSPRAQATPLAGFNTADGQNALSSVTTGVANTAIGWFSLKSNTDGSFNTGVGAGTLLLNIGDQSTGEGVENTAVGTAALLFNSTGSDNTAVGAAALLNNTTGLGNTAVGVSALSANQTGSDNTADGYQALLSNSIGTENTANGAFALSANTEGGANTANGDEALLNNSTGNDNTAAGRQALINNTTGGSNTATGESALFNNIDGGVNTATGVNALQNNTHGSNNTAIGVNALGGNATGSSNIGLGSNAGQNVTSASNVICIGADGNNVDNACYIGQIFGATSSGGTAVFVNSNGRLGTIQSSRRFKEEIKPMDRASETLFALKPVTFRYKKGIDPQGIPQFGLVAEDVEEANPDLVVRDKEGKVNTVRYEAVNAMLLNEFLKEHREVQELKSTVQRQERIIAQQQKSFECKLTEQEKQIEALTSGLEEVSAQVEVRKSASRVTSTNP